MEARPRPAYRPEAIAARERRYGSILVIRPISFTFATIFAFSIALVFLLVLIFGTYTKKNTVTGEIVPDKGLIDITSNQSGQIVQKIFSEGDSVRQGDILFSAQNVSAGIDTKDLTAFQLQTLKKKSKKIQSEMVLHKSNLREFELLVKKATHALQREHKEIKKRIQLQTRKLELTNELMKKYILSAQRGLISEVKLIQQKTDVLNKEDSLSLLYQQQATLERSIIDQETTFANKRATTDETLARLERELSDTRQQYAEAEVKGRMSITAPMDGVITAITVFPGQAFEAATNLASIVPKGSTFQARLFVPSSAVGFVSQGANVLLRYTAYPYQHFGQYLGIVHEVSSAPFTSKALKRTSTSSDVTPPALEPIFLVIVQVDNQHIQIGDVSMPLKAGMLLEADIYSTRLPLYQWIFEPLLSLSRI